MFSGVRRFGLIPLINEIEKDIPISGLIGSINILYGGNQITFSRDIAQLAVETPLGKVVFP